MQVLAESDQNEEEFNLRRCKAGCERARARRRQSSQRTTLISAWTSVSESRKHTCPQPPSMATTAELLVAAKEPRTAASL